MTFPRHRRIGSARAIADTFATARPLHGNGLTLRIRGTRSGGPTFAVIVPRSVQKTAVGRNTVRRRIAERLRKVADTMHIRADAAVVITVHRDMRTAEIDEALVSLLKKSGMVSG